MNSDLTWPQAPGGESLSPPLSLDDLRAFAGTQATVSPLMKPVDYYVPRWVAVLSEQSVRGGFNWAAAFFGAYWCFWRKLYTLAFVILIAELLSTLLIGFIFLQGFDWQPTRETIGLQGWIAALPVRFLLGAHANTLYLARAIEAVGEARKTHADPDTQHDYLALRGGTSWLALGILIGLHLCLFAIGGTGGGV